MPLHNLSAAYDLKNGAQGSFRCVEVATLLLCKLSTSVRRSTDSLISSLLSSCEPISRKLGSNVSAVTRPLWEHKLRMCSAWGNRFGSFDDDIELARDDVLRKSLGSTWIDLMRNLYPRASVCLSRSLLVFLASARSLLPSNPPIFNCSVIHVAILIASALQML